MTTITALPPPPSRSDPTNFAARGDTFLAALPAFATEANAVAAEINAAATQAAANATAAAGHANAAAQSTTSLTIGTGNKVLIVPEAKSWVPGMPITIYNGPTTYMVGVVVAYSYSFGQGSLTVSVQAAAGSGTFAAWSIFPQTWYREIPINAQSTGYTLTLADSGKCLLHPSSDAVGRSFFIPSNAEVAFPIGTKLTFVNQAGAGNLAININSDVMRLAGPGTTGVRFLAPNGIAQAIKLAATEWLIDGKGLT